MNNFSFLTMRSILVTEKQSLYKIPPPTSVLYWSDSSLFRTVGYSTEVHFSGYVTPFQTHFLGSESVLPQDFICMCHT